jgi:hypothetical protein
MRTNSRRTSEPIGVGPLALGTYLSDFISTKLLALVGALHVHYRNIEPTTLAILSLLVAAGGCGLSTR